MLAEAVRVWVKPTEATGGAEEAHSRWPAGRSEQASCSESDTARRGAIKAKADPPKSFRLAMRRMSLHLGKDHFIHKNGIFEVGCLI